MDMDSHLDQTLTLQVRCENRVLGGGSHTLTQESRGVAGLSPPWAISVPWAQGGSENAPGMALPDKAQGSGLHQPSTSAGEKAAVGTPLPPRCLVFLPLSHFTRPVTSFKLVAPFLLRIILGFFQKKAN